MPTFGIIIEPDRKVQEYLDMTNDRLQSVNYIMNPFTGYVISFPLAKKLMLTIIKINPIYADISIIGLLGSIGIYAVWGWSYWMLPFIAIALSHYFFTPSFYITMLKAGLKKAGYKDIIKIVKPDFIIDTLVVNDGR